MKLPIKVIIVSSSLPQFFSYLVPKTKSASFLWICSSIFINSFGLNDPSALNIQNNSVSVEFIPVINASP